MIVVKEGCEFDIKILKCKTSGDLYIKADSLIDYFKFNIDLVPDRAAKETLHALAKSLVRLKNKS